MNEVNISLVLNKIKDNNKIFYSEWNALTVNDLLSKDENNITYFEYLFKNNIEFMYNLSDRCMMDLTSNIDALRIGLKYGNMEWLRYFDNEDILYEPIEDNKNTIELIFERKLRWYRYDQLKKNMKIFDYMIKYQPYSLSSLNKEIVEKLFTKVGDSYPYDKYVNDDNVNSKFIICVPKELIINYCIEKNKYELFRFCNEKILLEEINNKTILEILLDKNIEPLITLNEKHSFDILVEKNRYDLAVNCIIPPNIIPDEKLINAYCKELNISLDDFYKRRDWLITYYKNNNEDIFNTFLGTFYRYDLLSRASVYPLTQKYNDKETYLELLFKKQKDGMELHLEDKIFGLYKYREVDEIVDSIMLFLKNDMIGYIIADLKKNVEVLMYKGKGDKSVLEYLLEIDRNLVIDKLIPRLKSQKNPEFYIFLRNFGIDNATLRLEKEDKSLCNEYIKDFNEMYDDGCISEYEDALQELKTLFYEDGTSDKEIVDALIKSYRYLTSQKNEAGIQELYKLIEIKKRNYKDFCYVINDDGAFFNKKQVNIDVNVINTINHETSHALHYYLTKEEIPDNYDEVVERVKNDSEIFNRINEFSKKYERITEILKESLSKTRISDYIDNKYSGEKLEEVTKFLESSKEEKKEKLKDSYSEEVLDILLDKTYSKDAFIEQRKKVEEIELLKAIIYSEYDSYLAIADIVDAVFGGKQFSGVLFDNKGENVKASAGHGVSYYGPREDKRFCEMVANYGSIIKSKESAETINYLRKIVGDELVDMIENFYIKTMLESNTYVELNKSEEEVKSHGR